MIVHVYSRKRTVEYTVTHVIRHPQVSYEYRLLKERKHNQQAECPELSHLINLHSAGARSPTKHYDQNSRDDFGLTGTLEQSDLQGAQTTPSLQDTEAAH